MRIFERLFGPRSTVDHVVGQVSKQEKRKIEKQMEKRFLTQYIADGLPERLKTSEERDIIKLANRGTNEVLRYYGERGSSIPPEAIHIIAKEHWSANPYLSGTCIPTFQLMLMQEERDPLIFFMHLFHEILHMKSYFVVQLPTREDKSDPLKSYRFGFMAHSRDGQKEYFRNLNEAITEELVKRFAQRYVNQEPLGKAHRKALTQIEGINRFRSQQKLPPLSGDVFAISTQEDLDAPPRIDGKKRHLITAVDFAYEEERVLLEELCKKMTQRCPEKFPTKEIVFDCFAKAMFDGKIMALGRSIDAIFGKGTFRRIGEAGEDAQVLKRVIQGL